MIYHTKWNCWKNISSVGTIESSIFNSDDTIWIFQLKITNCKWCFRRNEWCNENRMTEIDHIFFGNDDEMVNIFFIWIIQFSKMKIPSKIIIISNHVFIHKTAFLLSVSFCVCPKEIVQFLNFFPSFQNSLVSSVACPKALDVTQTKIIRKRWVIHLGNYLRQKIFGYGLHKFSFIFGFEKITKENVNAKSPEKRKLHLATVVCSIAISIHHS